MTTPVAGSAVTPSVLPTTSHWATRGRPGSARRPSCPGHPQVGLALRPDPVLEPDEQVAAQSVMSSGLLSASTVGVPVPSGRYVCRRDDPTRSGWPRRLPWGRRSSRRASDARPRRSGRIPATGPCGDVRGSRDLDAPGRSVLELVSSLGSHFALHDPTCPTPANLCRPGPGGRTTGDRTRASTAPRHAAACPVARWSPPRRGPTSPARRPRVRRLA